jgi:hypothetical protein
MEKQQTAVEWLLEKITLKKLDDKIILYPTISNKDIDQAKEMEKEQIINAWDLGRRDIDYPMNGEQYYNEKIKNK